MTKVELRATWGLVAIFILRMLGIFMVLPVLTTYGMKLHNADQSLIGLAIGIYGLVQSICQIPIGMASDRLGYKLLIIVGLLIFTLGSIIAALTDSIWGIIFGRAVQGIGTITAAVMAMLSDLTMEQNRTKAMAVIGISFSLAFAIAIVLGPIITSTIGLSGLFWCITMLTMTSVIIALLTLPTSNRYKLNRESNIICSSIATILLNKQLLKLNFGIFCLHSILMFNFVVLPQNMMNMGFLPADQWKIYLIAVLISFFVVMPCIVYAEKKQSIKKIFICGVTILLCAQISLLAAGFNRLIFLIGIQLFFLSFYLMEGLLPSLISKVAPPSLKGTAMGFYSTSQFIGVACGGIIGGWLFSLPEGASLVFIASISIVLAWLFVSLTMSEPPYVTSIIISVPPNIIGIKQLITHQLLTEQAVKEVLIIPEENSAYLKVDTKYAKPALIDKLKKIVNNNVIPTDRCENSSIKDT
ncbi:MFS transporter [Candidatus Palibaumannia cicadellinicola]|uniref:Transporter, major facilitator family n=1 Tax=Baumannia cicadellinicola subsp. Homalodisca coagulata TaxID=374463 RepID=Q1LTJ3_BAUCH|nr:MFS transporter [Candidatus Baumannia cicadellinicola]ABF13988.1 transporter, major facilitator family [Baumannia cicadellinicola str. Hc (Homalodisca coagulata)]MCJ7462295.1 MFS transporter [Candidatus Baumannia cicadellinicola]MCJ7462815.1 MFS transporter [Candidatus Baumannia cicadellinicola]